MEREGQGCEDEAINIKTGQSGWSEEQHCLAHGQCNPWLQLQPRLDESLLEMESCINVLKEETPPKGKFTVALRSIPGSDTVFGYLW